MTESRGFQIPSVTLSLNLCSSFERRLSPARMSALTNIPSFTILVEQILYRSIRITLSGSANHAFKGDRHTFHGDRIGGQLKFMPFWLPPGWHFSYEVYHLCNQSVHTSPVVERKSSHNACINLSTNFSISTLRNRSAMFSPQYRHAIGQVYNQTCL